ncbi:MAG: WYL domain-containing protein, partial [Halothiobacillaceae bacterium]|nr:WYL domain-containing protein [Halothiobacillaceae bacterium]
MSETLLRQWAMLRFIPRAPRRIDTKTLQDKLSAAGYDINLRSIQRDLNKLSQVLPLVGDEHKPQGWSWQADAAVFDVP